MHSVQKVLTKRLPDTSRKINVSIGKTSTPKVHREIKANLETCQKLAGGRGWKIGLGHNFSSPRNRRAKAVQRGGSHKSIVF